MAAVRIDVTLPKHRDRTGMMLVCENGPIVAMFSVLGRGSRGTGNTQMAGDGNTPTGIYDGSEWADTNLWNQKSYGPNGAVRLKPVSGNTMMASSLGRAGLLIHGGAAGAADYSRGGGALRATHGCLRLNNADMKRLRVVYKRSMPAPRNQSEMITVANVLASQSHSVRVDVSEY